MGTKVKTADYHFCMKQFKPAIIVIAVLAALVVGFTAYREGAYGRRDVVKMMGNGNVMQAATAAPIKAGVKATHPDWGPCTNCHDVIGAGGAGATKAAVGMQIATAPPIRAGQKAPHPDFGPCLRCHDMIPPPPAVPAGQTAPHPNWGKCTDCHKIIPGLGTRVAMGMPVASVAPPLGGVWFRPITIATAQKLGLDNADGVIVSGVQNSSAAYAAGLRIGDIVFRIDNQKVENIQEALIMIAAKGPQDTLKLQVLRNGKEKKIFVKISDNAPPPTAPPVIHAAATGQLSGRIAVAASGPGLGAQIAPDFARAPVFVLYDPATRRLSSLSNPGANTLTAGAQATSQLTGRGITAVISGNIGPSSMKRLRQSGIQVYTGAFGSVENVLGQYLQGSLVPATRTVIPRSPPATARNTTKPPDKVAIASTGSSLNSPVANDLGMAPYLIFYDFKTGKSEVISKDPAPDMGTNAVQTVHLIVNRSASATVAGNISQGSVQNLSKLGVFSFAGVQGSVGQAIEMYRTGKLRASTTQAQSRSPAAAGQGMTL